jgi:ribonuclease G
MSKELVISANRHETRVALLEDDQLVEVYFQRANEYSLAGSIHKGRVTRVLPGMQSAFVDLGLERDTFLYVSDFLDEHEDIDHVTPHGSNDERPSQGGRAERDRGRRRDRDRQPQQQSVATPVPASEAIPSDPPSVGAEEIVARASEPRPEAESRPTEGGERRRRRRRRGRGNRGLPESKYAFPGPDLATAASPTEDAATLEPDETDDGTPEDETIAERVVLPGESIAKYRSAAAVEESSGATATEEVDESETEYDEPAHFPRENLIPDAPRHPLPAEGNPKLETDDELQLVRPAEPEPAPTEQELDAVEEAADSEPVVTRENLDEEEDRDIQAMILDSLGEDDSPSERDVDALQAAAESDDELATEGSTIEEGSDEAIEAESSAEPSSQVATDGDPVSASAEIRERGGRFPHRMSRRGRRRRGGGGGDRQPRVDTVAEPAQAVAPPSAPPQGERPRQITAQNRSTPSISDLLKQGQEIIVQIAKEPLGQKGARITSHVALPGRFVVYMPTLEHMGVSRRIASDEERQRLKRVLQAHRPGTVGGFITRTAAEGRTEEEIAADMEFLYNLWTDIKAKADKKPAPTLLHHDLDIVQRVLRDQLADDFKAIWIDNEDTFESILRFVERFQPSLVGKVKMYTREAPIFDSFGITQEMEKALRPKVWLKSGGYIVINQTEALVAIDVNTGKFVGKSNRLEDTIVKTNTEAIKEIVRQVRLRDLGGIIVIDFIDMDERKNRQKVMAALEEAMRADRAPYKILQFNDFGLVAITRKRVKQSLERTLCSPCPHCEGAGYVKSVQTVVSEILTEARKLAGSVEGKDVMLRVHPDVAKVIKSHQNKYLEELEETLRRPVLVKSDPLLHHEKFDLA